MKNKKLTLLLLVLVVICLLVGFSKRVKAVEIVEVPPYKFATVTGGAEVYKGVHEGCEFFVVREYASRVSHGDTVSVSIALGRGCK
jgi:hypothetical protein